MFTVVITEKGGEQRRLDFDKPEITIGRVQGNDIILPKGNVSKRHSRIVLKDAKFIIVDLKSTNGTYVNGRKITSPLVIKGSDKIYIGDFILHIEDGTPSNPSQPQVAAPVAPPSGPEPPSAPPKRPPPPLPRRKPSRPVGGQAMDEPEGVDAPPLGPQAVERQRVATPPPSMRRMDPSSQSARPPVRDTLGGDLMDSQAEPELTPASPGHPERIPPPQSQDISFRSPPPAKIQHTAKGQLSPAPPSAPRRSAASRQPPQGMRASAEDPRRAKIVELQKEVHDRLLEHLDLRRMDIDQLADEELWEKTENAICDIVENMDSEGAIPAFVNQDELIKDVLNEALGLGPLEDLLADESIDEIMVNRMDQIFIERGGSIDLTPLCFSSDKAILGVIERIVAPLGRRIDESSPLVDARLKDGSRVNAIIPPLALRGPTLTIRKFRREAFTAEQMIQLNTISRQMVDFLNACVVARKNIIISGGTGSGKTTMLNVVSNFIPPKERIITIEDAAELQLKHEHWVQLESRPPNIEGKGSITIRDLVRNALRMRPDRIIVGECRSGEAIDMLQAMNTGHDGSLTTAHANSPRDTLSRLETMVLMSGMELPVKAIREQIVSAIDLIVFESRFSDGTRKITHITEVAGMEGDVITTQDIFSFKQEGFDNEGRVQGRFIPSGFIPRFYEELQRRGIPVDMSIFRE